MQDVEIRINPALRKGVLYAFYKRNGICEAGYGRDVAETVLKHPCVTVGAFRKDRLVGFGRALFDGLHAVVVEFSLDLRFQANNTMGNGCFVDSDPHGIAKRMGEDLLVELRGRGCCFFSILVWTVGERAFYKALGFHENRGAREFVIDERPYVKKARPNKAVTRLGRPARGRD